MPSVLEEVTVALEKKRHELVISGPAATKSVEEDGFDERLYDCHFVNYLDVSGIGLKELKPDLKNLCNLTNLVLRGNLLEDLPCEIGLLSKLKLLDISRNKLSCLPEEMCKLNQLQTFNVSNNCLKSVPDLSVIESLLCVDISHNQLDVFPSFLCQNSLLHLNEVYLNDNCLEEVLPDIKTLTSLKILDLCNNQLSNVPGEIGDCLKLKEVRLKSNKLKDRRLLKLVDQCHYKQVIEYIRKNCPKCSTVDSSSTSKGKGKNKKKKAAATSTESSNFTIKVKYASDSSLCVKIQEEVLEIRPHIVCCVVHGVDLQDNAAFKKFLSIQTKLHDSICAKRTNATIATHDLSKVVKNISYSAKDPEKIMIRPLNRQKEISTAALYKQLRDEAESLRKEKKRNTFSGVHKYLYLLDHKELYPYIQDESGSVISFPPITNSDVTKISPSTVSILIEVTSSVSIPICKQVMEALLQEMMQQEIGLTSDSDEKKLMSLEQIRILDVEGNLKAVYPSRADLKFDDAQVIYE